MDCCSSPGRRLLFSGKRTVAVIDDMGSRPADFFLTYPLGDASEYYARGKRDIHDDVVVKDKGSVTTFEFGVGAAVLCGVCSCRPRHSDV